LTIWSLCAGLLFLRNRIPDGLSSLNYIYKITRKRRIFVKILAMTLQLEITNPEDAELILSLARRLNIPFKQRKKKVVKKTEREKAIERIRNFKAKAPSSFGDALEWQIKEREDRPLPFDEIR